MAFGFPPKYEARKSFDDVTQNQLLTLAVEAAKFMDLDIHGICRDGFEAFTKFSMRSWSEEIQVKIEGNILMVYSSCKGNQILDYGKNKKNVEGFLEKVSELIRVMSKEAIDIRYQNLSEEMEHESLNEGLESENTNTADVGITSIFIPKRGFFVTPSLFWINTIIFIVMIASGVHIMTPESQDLIDWGANFRSLTLSGDWWRLFTSCFLHIGILHLLMNMYALIYIGLILEPYLGKTRFLAAYMITGFCSSVASIWWHDFTVSAGASGAIFGMYGVFLAMLTAKVIDKEVRQALMTSVLVFVGYNLLNGIKADSGVDNAAHIGGLLSGLMVGFAFVPSLKQVGNIALKFSTVAVLSVVAVLSASFVLKNLSNDLPKFEQAMERFQQLEEKALSIYSLPETTEDDEFLDAIDELGIESWKECIAILQSLKTLNLPKMLEEQNNKLLIYAELRLQSFELIYKSVEEQSDRYDSKIDSLYNEINAVLESINANSKE